MSETTPMDLAAMKAKTVPDLQEVAKSLDIESTSSMRKQELIFKILEGQTEKNGLIFCRGRAADPARGLRFPALAQVQLPAGPDDIYVSPSQIKKFDLQTGDTIRARCVRPRTASGTSRC